MRPSIPIDPEVGIPDLVRRLADDSKRLAQDEVRLAKLELHESVHAGIGGAIRLAVALAFGVVATVALTVLLVMIGARIFDNVWAGALVVGALELVGGGILLGWGLGVVKQPSYTLEQSRESLKNTAHWARHPTSP